jgi:hypothetical protein
MMNLAIKNSREGKRDNLQLDKVKDQALVGG